MKINTSEITKWILPQPININEINNCQINYTLQKVLYRRGFNLEDELIDFITPSELPNPESHFKELDKATQRIIKACTSNEKIAICGDYDADGITSTVLLVELFSKLGGNAIPFIPSRNEDGYGLNLKMINDINSKEIKLAVTVDNGIAAFDAIKKANELDIDLIITDHHKITDKNIDIYSLIHPEETPENSPYKFLAGVGVAYMLAKNICNKLNFNIDQTTAKELFCIGTIADMAPLIGANRKWLKEYLPKINTTDNIGIRTILRKLELEQKYISSDDIGYKIAPLINAVGRISDPSLILNLLTNSSIETIKKLTKECFSINKERKRLTTLVETDAYKIALSEYSKQRKFLVLTNKHWHPGIIGIVAARIVDKFNLPTALLSQSNDGTYRGSIRSNNKLKVNLALAECSDILLAHGGHSAAAGFTIKEENIPILKDRLNNIAIREFRDLDLNKSINPDAHICLNDINNDFFDQLNLIGPFGIMNKAPIFWTRKCKIIEHINLKGNHLKMKLDDGTSIIDGIKWNYESEYKTNDLIDIAFHIELNNWKNINKLQLNILDIKSHTEIIDLQLHNRNYKCQLIDDMKIKITNSMGNTLCSSLPVQSIKKNINVNYFEKKILSFAEIALGKTA